MKLVLALLSLCVTLFSQNDTIKITPQLLELEHIQYGESTYLVYMQDQKGNRSNISIWKRTLKYENNSLFFTSHTEFDKAGSVWRVETTLNKDTFLPKSEKTFYSKELTKNKDVRKHFTFTKNKTYTATDTSIHNSNPVNISYTDQPFNWQLDLETFSLLPLKENTTFGVNFYHPGGMPPKIHYYTVLGSENVELNTNEIECFVLLTTYENGNYGKWWISKRTRKTIKLEERFNGRYRFKILLDQGLLGAPN